MTGSRRQRFFFSFLNPNSLKALDFTSRLALPGATLAADENPF
jgi:hypothetical protein